VSYFLLLLSYRAFSGQGRKKDGRLLPPLTVKVFAALWAIILCLAVFLNVADKNLWRALFALLTLGFCIKILVYGDADDPD
jgi:hypothetical protein